MNSRSANARRKTMRIGRRSRRGVLLLVILSMLVIFLMTAVAFVVIARNFRVSAAANANNDRVVKPADELLDAAMYDLLRDTNNPHSRARYHSLLMDLYGSGELDVVNPFTILCAHYTDGTGIKPATTDPPLNGQFMDIHVTLTDGIDNDEDGDVDEADEAPSAAQMRGLSTVTNYYNGHVLTIRSSINPTVGGLSTRVVGYLPPHRLGRHSMQLFEAARAQALALNLPPALTGALHNLNPNVNTPVITFRVMALKPEQSATAIPAQSQVASVGPLPLDQFILNDRPLNGTGVGFDPTDLEGAQPNAALLSAMDQTRPIISQTSFEDDPGYPLALLPNSAFFRPYRENSLTPVMAPFLPYFVTATDRGRLSLASDNVERLRLQKELIDRRGLAGLGGMDEGYDVPDYQNVFLGYVPLRPNVAASASSPDEIVHPSFHPRAVINYWHNQAGDAEAVAQRIFAFNSEAIRLTTNPEATIEKDLARKVVMRPLPFDHPHFPRLDNLVNGDWDVDNDGDGVPDSVWIDLGYPPTRAADGRWYKPMFAVLVQDMDGRLNVNAHGSWEQFGGFEVDDDARARRRQHYQRAEKFSLLATPANADQIRRTSDMPKGQGYGPPEISLVPLLDAFVGAPGGMTMAQQILAGKYGADGFPGQPPADPSFEPLRTGWDPLAQMKFREYPVLYHGGVATGAVSLAAGAPPTQALEPQVALRGFSTPPDLKGQYGLGVDYYGFPNFENVFRSSDAGFSFNDPTQPIAGGQTMASESAYELNLLDEQTSSPTLGGVDSPYTVAELEPILRAFHEDASALPDRLSSGFAAVLSSNPNVLRQSITTNSFSLPVPPLSSELTIQVGDDETRTVKRRYHHIVEMLEQRLRTADPDYDKKDQDEKERIVGTLMSPDLLDNLPFNLNRPFGDGIDNDRDGAVDEEDEATGDGFDNDQDGQIDEADERNWLLGPQFPNADPKNIAQRRPDGTWLGVRQADQPPPPVYSAVGNLDEPRLSNDIVKQITPDPNQAPQNAAQQSSLRARQQSAKELFVLMMTLKDENFTFDFSQLANQGQNAQNPPQSPTPEEILTARRLAQWAINVVEFRDPDSIMTGFEVDLQPFVDNDDDPSNGTWDVDGNLGFKDDDQDGQPDQDDDTNQPWRVVLWGMERPQMLLTETLATHDLRLKDTENDVDHGDLDRDSRALRDGNADGPDNFEPTEEDDDLDQFLVPQGSLFVEMICMGNPNNGVMPQEIYSRVNDTWQLDLGRRPIHPETGSADPNPVWRLAVSQQFDASRSELVQLSRNSDTRTFQPNDMDMLLKDVPQDRVALERYVWFTPTRPDETDQAVRQRVPFLERTYTLYGEDALGAIAPGEYAVVGPRTETRFGPEDAPVNHGLMLDNQDGEVVYQSGRRAQAAGMPTFGTDVKQVRTMTAGIPISLDPGSDFFSGLNISEPLPRTNGAETYYPEPAGALAGYDQPYEFPIDKPLDLGERMPLNELLAQRGGLLTGTHNDVRTVYLQRLADPTSPWNPPPDHPEFGRMHSTTLAVNPYITVDWMPVDLCVFNSEEEIPRLWDPRQYRDYFISQQLRDNGQLLDIILHTRQRGQDVQRGQAESQNIFKAEIDRLPNVATGGDDISEHQLRHTLGFLNDTYGQWIVPQDLPGTQRQKSLGAPQSPFPWVTWNDRPFVSQLELLHVPFSEPGRFSVEHSTAAVDYDPYDTSQQVADQNRLTNKKATFGHLFNFFAATDSDNQGNATPNPLGQLHRVLDFTGVGSRFLGTETYLNPNQFDMSNGSPEFRRPPFNTISKYRDPGKVNLNTVFNPFVYQGLFQGDPATSENDRPDGEPIPHRGPSWQEFWQSRRGYTFTAENAPQLRAAERDQFNEQVAFAPHPQYPTFFAGLFGSAQSGNLVPPLGTDPTMQNRLVKPGVDRTLLRGIAIDNGDGSPPNSAGPNTPLFAATGASLSNRPDSDPDKNPYFRYQPMQRLANLTTSQSNVFAVWITVGFFEMEPVPANQRAAVITSGELLGPGEGEQLYNRLYPEGMWLGQEMGADNGDTQRYQSFYIIDRSIPVGFEPGINHNVDKAILLRRRLN